MKPYRLKHVVVRALQVTAEMFSDHINAGAPLPDGLRDYDPMYGTATVDDNLRGRMSIRATNWLVEDPQGGLFVVPDGRFRREYEVVADTDPNAAHQAAQMILKTFWLYDGYRVDSRGPQGLLLDALDLLDPSLAQRYRDGEAAGDLLDPKD